MKNYLLTKVLNDATHYLKKDALTDRDEALIIHREGQRGKPEGIKEFVRIFKKRRTS